MLFPISKSSNFDHNLMKLAHNVKYHNVFLEFDNGLYVNAICHHELLPFVDEKWQFL